MPYKDMRHLDKTVCGYAKVFSLDSFSCMYMYNIFLKIKMLL